MKKTLIAIFIGFLVYTFYFIYREEVPSGKEIVIHKQNPVMSVEDIKIPGTKRKKRVGRKKSKKIKKEKITTEEIVEKRDETFVELDKKGNMLVTSVFIDGKYVVYQGDILVSDKETFYKEGRDKKPLSVGKPLLWPGGVVPYVIKKGMPNEKDVNEAIEYLTKYTDVKFVPRKDEKGYVEFKKGENNCYASLGYREKKRQVVLEKGCGKREILHELMHILGFFHEQCREDRDNYLIVIWDNIDEKYHPQFRKIPMSLMHTEGSDFDFNSIMLYGPNFFALYPGEYTMTTISGDIYKGTVDARLSRNDIIRINSVY